MFRRRSRAALFSSATALALAAFTAPVAVMAQAATYNFDIPAQDLGSALRAFGQASRQQVVFDSELVRGRTSSALVGSFSADDLGLHALIGALEQRNAVIHGAQPRKPHRWNRSVLTLRAMIDALAVSPSPWRRPAQRARRADAGPIGPGVDQRLTPIRRAALSCATCKCHNRLDLLDSFGRDTGVPPDDREEERPARRRFPPTVLQSRVSINQRVVRHHSNARRLHTCFSIPLLCRPSSTERGC